MTDWEAWQGRTELRRDFVDESNFAKWCATFDRLASDDGNVPQGYHWCLCTPDAPTSTLGCDGHPIREDGPNSFLPPIQHLPRRMWASSRIAFLAPLGLGDSITRRSTILAIEAKNGGSGELVFVTVAHETFAAETLAVREVQTLVYREAAQSDALLSPKVPDGGQFDPSGWDAHLFVTPNEAQLFRYSALTFNSHRIHYDLPYAREVERYRGLVVHGPLTATLLLGLAQRELGDNGLSEFSFRGLSPAICGEPLHLVMRAGAVAHELGAFASDGRQVATASAA